MSVSVNCPRCGYANRPGNSFCANCAARLDVVLGPALMPRTQTPPPPEPPRWWDPVEMARRTSIDRTKTGILLVIVAMVLAPIPYVMYIGIIGG